MREGPHRSVAVILNLGGSLLDWDALSEVPRGRVVRAEFARGERSACVAATVEHDCPPGELVEAFRRWAAGRGWSVTVAPLEGPR
jgi:hypothetical protein